MNIRSSSFILLISMLLGSMVSCENREVSEPEAGKYAGPDVTSISEQIAFVEASIDDLNALIDAVDAENPSLEEAVGAMQEHVEYLGSGVSLKDAGLAAISLQVRVAGSVASVDVEQDVASKLDKIEASVKAWLGSDLYAVYPLAYAQARIDGLLADMHESKLYIDGIASDIEAGLRDEISADEIGSLDSDMAAQMKAATEMAGSLSDLATDVRCEYEQVLSFAVSGDEDYEIGNLNSLNKSVELALKSVDDSYTSLVKRVAQCESKLADLLERISDLEEEVEGLLDMIQSVTFVSESSDNGAVAYYNLSPQLTSDGLMKRVPTSQIELSYIVRPASASKSLVSSSVWNKEMKVLGYYADLIQTKAINPSDIKEFTIKDVVVNAQTGLVVVKIANSLTDDFYFKKIGVKMALSITSGKTDMTSQFVDVAPVDQSGNVYVESLRLSSSSIEIENGLTAKLSAELTPENPTTPGVAWTSSDDNIASVDANGVVTGHGVGAVVITATSKSINEWGQKLTASCNVKVNPSVKVIGSDSVEEGGQTTLSIQSPTYISPEYVKWDVGIATRDESGEITAFNTKNQAFASIDENGVVKGLKMYYDTGLKEYVPVTVRCTVEGAIPIVLYHDIRVVAVQPQGISINGMSDTDTQIRTKYGVALGLYGTIKPANVSSEYFKLSYLGNTPGFDGYFAASSVGTFDITVSVQPGGTGQYNYMYPKSRPLARNFSVVVEPYYVSSVSLPSTFTMNPNQTATLSPTFTSDVAGKEPTFKNLKWTSSNSSIVSVNETTGELTSHKTGTVTITATTSHANAVPSGQSQKSAKCVVTVKTPVAPIAVGDYYYSDGTWSTTRNSSKTVIGVVFATANAVASDPALRNDYPDCTNGLVVSIKEYTSAMAVGRGWSWADLGGWCSDKGYSYYYDMSSPCGYSNTKGYILANAASIDSYGSTIDVALFNSTSPVVKHRAAVSVPSIASAWYVPSYREMQLLYENREAVNKSINNVSGNPLHVTRVDYNDTAYQYWCSTIDLDNKTIRAFDMTSGGWLGTVKNDASVLPVRVVLAF